MSILEQLLGHDSGPLVQFIKYAISGGIATAAHIAVFHLAAWKIFPALQANDWAVELLHLRVEPEDDARRARNSMLDNGIAFLFSNFVAYELSIHWVFHAGRYAWYIEIAFFYLVAGVSIALGTFLMGFLIRRYGMRTTYAFISNLVTALLINYAMRRFVIFNG